MKGLLSVIAVVGLGACLADGGAAAVAPTTMPLAPPPLVFEANRGRSTRGCSSSPAARATRRSLPPAKQP